MKPELLGCMTGVIISLIAGIPVPLAILSGVLAYGLLWLLRKWIVK